MSPTLSNLRFFPGLDEVAEGGRKTATRKATRILRAGYICDIIRDQETAPPIFHWVIQDVETNEILGLGQSHTLAEAEITAVSFLDDLRVHRAI